MIKWIRIQNFESHKDTTVRFDEGFTTVTGDSNVGKSSWLKAMRYLAFGTWDSGYVRVGAKYSIISCRSSRGFVRAEKGEGVNNWKVKTKGKTYRYRRAGKRVPEKVAEVLGIGKQTVGGMPLGVNISSQLDQHFLIAAIEGKEVRASTAARIVDDLCGVRGVEGLMDDFHKDRNSCAAELSEIAEQVKAERDRRYDDDELRDLDNQVSHVEHLSERAEKLGQSEKALRLVLKGVHKNRERRDTVSVRLQALRESDILDTLLTEYESLQASESDLLELSRAWTRNGAKVRRVQRGLPEADVSGLADMLTEYDDVEVQLSALRRCSEDVLRNRRGIDRLRNRVTECEAGIEDVTRSVSEWLKENDVCPLSGGELFQTCKEILSQ